MRRCAATGRTNRVRDPLSQPMRCESLQTLVLGGETAQVHRENEILSLRRFDDLRSCPRPPQLKTSLHAARRHLVFPLRGVSAEVDTGIANAGACSP